MSGLRPLIAGVGQATSLFIRPLYSGGLGGFVDHRGRFHAEEKSTVTFVAAPAAVPAKAAAPFSSTEHTWSVAVVWKRAIWTGPYLGQRRGRSTSIGPVEIQSSSTPGWRTGVTISLGRSCFQTERSLKANTCRTLAASSK